MANNNQIVPAGELIHDYVDNNDEKMISIEDLGPPPGLNGVGQQQHHQLQNINGNNQNVTSVLIDQMTQGPVYEHMHAMIQDAIKNGDVLRRSEAARGIESVSRQTNETLNVVSAEHEQRTTDLKELLVNDIQVELSKYATKNEVTEAVKKIYEGMADGVQNATNEADALYSRKIDVGREITKLKAMLEAKVYNMAGQRTEEDDDKIQSLHTTTEGIQERQLVHDRSLKEIQAQLNQMWEHHVSTVRVQNIEETIKNMARDIKLCQGSVTEMKMMVDRMTASGSDTHGMTARQMSEWQEKVRDQVKTEVENSIRSEIQAKHNELQQQIEIQKQDTSNTRQHLQNICTDEGCCKNTRCKERDDDVQLKLTSGAQKIDNLWDFVAKVKDKNIDIANEIDTIKFKAVELAKRVDGGSNDDTDLTEKIKSALRKEMEIQDASHKWRESLYSKIDHRVSRIEADIKTSTFYRGASSGHAGQRKYEEIRSGDIPPLSHTNPNYIVWKEKVERKLKHKYYDPIKMADGVYDVIPIQAQRLCDKMFTAEDLRVEDGHLKVFEVCDKLYKEDTFVLKYNAKIALNNVSRKSDEKIKDYIGRAEHTYDKAKEAGCELDESEVVYEIIWKSRIDKEMLNRVVSTMKSGSTDGKASFDRARSVYATLMPTEWNFRDTRMNTNTSNANDDAYAAEDYSPQQEDTDTSNVYAFTPKGQANNRWNQQRQNSNFTNRKGRPPPNVGTMTRNGLGKGDQQSTGKTGGKTNWQPWQRRQTTQSGNGKTGQGKTNRNRPGWSKGGKFTRANANRRNAAGIKCWLCHEVGHTARFCRKATFSDKRNLYRGFRQGNWTNTAYNMIQIGPMESFECREQFGVDHELWYDNLQDGDEIDERYLSDPSDEEEEDETTAPHTDPFDTSYLTGLKTNEPVEEDQETRDLPQGLGGQESSYPVMSAYMIMPSDDTVIDIVGDSRDEDTVTQQYPEPEVEKVEESVFLWSQYKGKILVGKEKLGMKKDKWSLPGGKTEAGENMQMAVVREIYEEISVRANWFSMIHRGTVEVKRDTTLYIMHIMQPTEKELLQIVGSVPKETMQMMDLGMLYVQEIAEGEKSMLMQKANQIQEVLYRMDHDRRYVRKKFVMRYNMNTNVECEVQIEPITWKHKHAMAEDVLTNGVHWNTGDPMAAPNVLGTPHHRVTQTLRKFTEKEDTVQCQESVNMATNNGILLNPKAEAIALSANGNPVAALDTGCTGSLMSYEVYKVIRDWYRSRGIRLQSRGTDRSFRVAGGRVVKSLMQIQVPIMVKEVSIGWWCDVAPSDDKMEDITPFLIGCEFMKEFGILPDIRNEKILVRYHGKEEEVPVIRVSGNPNLFCMEICSDQAILPERRDAYTAVQTSQFEQVDTGPAVNMQTVDVTQYRDKKRLRALHGKFAHNGDKMVAVLEAAGCDKETLKMAKEIIKDCPQCRNYANPVRVTKKKGMFTSRPNEVVSVDTMETTDKKLWMLMVDNFSGFMMVKDVQDKSPMSTLKTVFAWIFLVSEYPEKILHDNGSEYEGVFARWCEENCIVQLETGSYAHHRNMAERYIGTFKRAYAKMMSDNDLPVRDARLVGGMISVARNSLPYKYGFSANMLMFGRGTASITGTTEPATMQSALSYLANKEQLRLEAINAVACAEAHKSLISAEENRLSTNRELPEIGDFVDYIVEQIQGKNPTWSGKGIVINRVGSSTFEIKNTRGKIISRSKDKVRISQDDTHDLVLDAKIMRVENTPSSVRSRQGSSTILDGGECEKWCNEVMKDGKLAKNVSDIVIPQKIAEILAPISEGVHGFVPRRYRVMRGVVCTKQYENDVMTSVYVTKNGVSAHPVQDASMTITMYPTISVTTVAEEAKIPDEVVDDVIQRTEKRSETVKRTPVNRVAILQGLSRGKMEHYLRFLGTKLIGNEGQKDVFKLLLGRELALPIQPEWYKVLTNEDLIRYRDMDRRGQQYYEEFFTQCAEKRRLNNVRDVNMVYAIQEITEADDKPNGRVPGVVANKNAVGPEWHLARTKEINSWVEHDAVSVVQKSDMPRNAKVITSRWLHNIKNNELRSYKARLIVRGFQDDAAAILDTSSPTVGKLSVRMLLIIAVSFGWLVHSVDISTAFLFTKPDNLPMVTFVEPPKQFIECIPEKLRCNDMQVWRANTALYGTAFAPQAFYKELSEQILKMDGCVRIMEDPCVFRISFKNKFEGMIVTHVDDILFAGSKHFHHNFKAVLDHFKIKKIEVMDKENKIRFCGADMKYNSQMQVEVDQDEYVSTIELHPALTSGKNAERIPEKDITHFRQVVGKLAWLAVITVPSLLVVISYVVAQLSHAPTYELGRLLVRTVEALKAESTKITIMKIGDPNTWGIVTYVDASYKTMPLGKSQLGIVHGIINKDKWNEISYYPKGYGLLKKEMEFPMKELQVNVVHWTSHRISRVCTSSFAAETLAFREAIDSHVYLQNFIRSTLGTDIFGINAPIFTDSLNLMEKILRENQLSVEKSMITDIALIREFLSHGMGVMRWIPGKYQQADWLTKVKSGNIQLSRQLVNKNRIFLPDLRSLQELDVATEETELGKLVNPTGNPAVTGPGRWGLESAPPVHYTQVIVDHM